MKLTRRIPERQLISLVPMIDVMLILLVFFMVTSTYLNLDMIPFAARADETPNERQEVASDIASDQSSTLLVRISADGQYFVRGRAMDPPDIQSLVSDRLAQNPLLSVVLLPSTQASTQNLVSAMDLLTSVGATRLRLVQVEARP